MSAVVTIELAGEPRGKGRPRFRRFKPKGKPEFVSTYTDVPTRDYEALLRDAAEQAMAGRPLMDAPLRVLIIATFGVPRSWSKKKTARALEGLEWPAKKPDADNVMKLCDALNGVVWRDDALIVDASVTKVYGDRPSLSVEVWELGGDHA